MPTISKVTPRCQTRPDGELYFGARGLPWFTTSPRWDREGRPGGSHQPGCNSPCWDPVLASQSHTFETAQNQPPTARQPLLSQGHRIQRPLAAGREERSLCFLEDQPQWNVTNCAPSRHIPLDALIELKHTRADAPY